MYSGTSCGTSSRHEVRRKKYGRPKIQKEKGAFVALYTLWASKEVKSSTKFRIIVNEGVSN